MLDFFLRTNGFGNLGNEVKTRGFSTLNELLNVVAPPISEHEVIQVWLSHDMEGYEGVESVVYRALARVSRSTVGILGHWLNLDRLWSKWKVAIWL